MGYDFRMPNITGTDSEQLAQIRSYLYQFIPQLQWALNSIETSPSCNYVVQPTRSNSAPQQSSSPKASFNDVRSPETIAADLVTDIGVWNIDDNDTDKGYWRYRKWKSGAIDMNGLIKVEPVSEGTLGTAGVHYSQVINIDLPFEVVNFQFTGSSTSYHIFVGNANSVDGNNKQIQLRLYRFTDFPNLDQYTVYVRIVASGKLK